MCRSVAVVLITDNQEFNKDNLKLLFCVVTPTSGIQSWIHECCKSKVCDDKDSNYTLINRNSNTVCDS